jgi:hypothetical protein
MAAGAKGSRVIETRASRSICCSNHEGADACLKIGFWKKKKQICVIFTQINLFV